MDTRDTPEQAELRRSARSARPASSAAATVADLDDATRAKRLAAAVRDAGWLELRDDGGRRRAARRRGRGGDRRRRARRSGRRRRVRRPGARARPRPPRRVRATSTVRSSRSRPTLTGAAVVPGARDDDADLRRRRRRRASTRRTSWCPTAPATASRRCASTRAPARAAPISRARVRAIPAGTPVHPVADQRRLLTRDDLAGWTALGLALTSADLVGVMRGVLDVTVAYAAERRQYGVPVGSFQAVQHLLAEARCLMEGSLSVSLHASWAVDNLAPDDALRRRAASPRRTAHAPRAPSARPRCRCTAGSATRGSASCTCTCGARCSRRSGSATTATSSASCSASAWG